MDVLRDIRIDLSGDLEPYRPPEVLAEAARAKWADRMGADGTTLLDFREILHWASDHKIAVAWMVGEDEHAYLVIVDTQTYQMYAAGQGKVRKDQL